MRQREQVAGRPALAGVRIALLAEGDGDLDDVEDALLAAGAVVRRSPLSNARWRAADDSDLLLISLDEPQGAAGQVDDSVLALVRSLVPRHRVMALVHRAQAVLIPGLRDVAFGPFRPDEVIARALRILAEPAPRQELHLGNLVLNDVNRSVTLDGHAVMLTFQEFELLRTLLDAGGAVLSREEIADRAGQKEAVTGRAIDIHVHRLRTKLAGLRGARIETVRGVGYRLAHT